MFTTHVPQTLLLLATQTRAATKSRVFLCLVRPLSLFDEPPPDQAHKDCTVHLPYSTNRTHARTHAQQVTLATQSKQSVGHIFCALSSDTACSDDST